MTAEPCVDLFVIVFVYCHSKASDLHICIYFLHFIENKIQNLLLCLCAGNVTCMRIYLKLASLMNFSFKIHHKSNTGTNQYQIKLNHKQPKIS